MKQAIQRVLRKNSAHSIGISLSDNQKYPQFCLDASNHLGVFNRFRREKVYTKILEHVSQEQGQAYLEIIKDEPELYENLSSFKANDAHGGPICFEYPGVGKISPTTLRYVKVLCDLKQYFGTLDGFSISEIGVGYGGQCRVINAHYKPTAYKLIDLQPALALTQRYLDNYILESTLSYQTMNELSTETSELFISNYAFSELIRPLQEVYFDRVIAGAKRGYITHNTITPEEFNSFTAEELVERIPGARIEQERPLSFEGNCVIVWGD